MKIGLNWINRLGILLLILAVGAGFRYSYSTWFNDYMKGSAFFLLGAIMLGGGEWLFRKGRGAFALGLIGGGVSVLYGSVFYSYFYWRLSVYGPGSVYPYWSLYPLCCYRCAMSRGRSVPWGLSAVICRCSLI